MQKANPIRDKSYGFALKILDLSKLLTQRGQGTVARQILRSGTSIGANVEEALHGQSRKDFIAKLSIALKEAHETRYWLRLLGDSGLIPEGHLTTLLSDVGELIGLLTAIITTSKKRSLHHSAF